MLNICNDHSQHVEFGIVDELSTAGILSVTFTSTALELLLESRSEAHTDEDGPVGEAACGLHRTIGPPAGSGLPRLFKSFDAPDQLFDL